MVSGCLGLAGYAGFVYGETQSKGGGDRPQVQLQVDASPLDRSNTTVVSSYADILDRVTPAVVSVRTSRIIQVSPRGSRRGGDGGGGPANPLEEFMRRFYGLPNPEPDDAPPPPRDYSDERVERVVPSGMGSGVVVSDQGYVLTNHHIIVGRDGSVADEIIVQLGDGREFEAEVVGSDPQTDVAVLKIEGDDLPGNITLADSDSLRVGDIVFAIGNPLEVGLTVTQGIVSAVDRSNLGILGMEGYENFIQTDAAINFGNSGGPLVDAQGRVVGLNTAILSRSGGNIGIGFAIPVNLASYIMGSLVERGEVRRGFLGVDIRNVDRDLAAAIGLSSTRGALVNSAEPGLPADLGGIEHGDVLIAVDGQPVASASDLRFMISRRQPGSTVDVTLIRGGETIVLPIELGDRDELLAPSLGATAAPQRPVLEGVTIRPLDDDSRESYSVPANVNGLLITGVEVTSPYAANLAEGMVIISVNREPVTSVRELREALRSGEQNLVRIYFRGRFNHIPLSY